MSAPATAATTVYTFFAAAVTFVRKDVCGGRAIALGHNRLLQGVRPIVAVGFFAPWPAAQAARLLPVALALVNV